MVADRRMWLALIVWIGSCTDEPAQHTEVIVTVDARNVDGAASLRVTLASRTDGSEPELTQPQPTRRDYKLLLHPKDGDATREYVVTAEALDGREVVAMARLVSGFVEGEQLRVSMVPESGCPACSDDQTCREGCCTSARVDPDDLERGPEESDLRELIRPQCGDAGAPQAGAGAGTGGAGAPSAGSGGAGLDGGVTLPPEACEQDGSRCDPLTDCVDSPEGPHCSACPTGYVGAGETGCTAVLTDLVVTSGELTFPLMPAFDPGVSDQHVLVPLSISRVLISPRGSAGAVIAIGGSELAPDEPWESPVLDLGTSVVSITADGGDGEILDYTLTLTRGEQHAYVKASPPQVDAHLGGSVAISGDTLVVGAADQSGGSGAAHVFLRGDTGWTAQANLERMIADAGDLFGYSVASSGDTIVVGAPWEDSNATGVDHDAGNNLAELSGAAYVFTRNAGAWTQQAYLKASNTSAGDGFGNSVAIAGDTIVVGAPFEDSSSTVIDGGQDDETAEGSGAAYVFTRDGTAWTQLSYLKPSNTRASQQFGHSVAISEDGAMVVVGAKGDDDEEAVRGRGSVHIFVRDPSPSNWSSPQALRAAEPLSLDESFGFSVAISGTTLVVGVSSDNRDSAIASGARGAAYVFEYERRIWQRIERLTAANPDAGDNFGHSVGIAGDLLVVGAPYEGGGMSGIFASTVQPDNALPLSGAVYVFERAGASWPQRGYLKASNVGAGAGFGTSVGIAGGMLVVGAPGEAEAATGSGACYGFR